MGHFTKRHITKRHRVKFNNTRRKVHVYTPTELSPIPKPDMFDKMLAKMNATKLRVPGKYLRADRNKVASAAPSRLAIRHTLRRLGEALKGIPENDELALSTLLMSPRFRRSKRTHSTHRSHSNPNTTSSSSTF